MEESEYDLYPSRPESRPPNVYGTYPCKANQSQRLKVSSLSRVEANGQFPLLFPPSQQSTLEASEMDWPSPGLPPTPVRSAKLLHKKPKDDFYSAAAAATTRQKRFDKTGNDNCVFMNGGSKSDYSHLNLETNRNTEKSTSRKIIYFCKYTSKALLTELIVVGLCTFLHLHVQHQLLNQFNKSVQKLILSVIDACLVAVCLNAFQKVHFNPVVSIAHLFSMTTPWYLCILIAVMQFFGSILAAFVFMILYRSEYMEEIEKELRLLLNNSMSWNVYKMMLNQFLGLTLVVVSHLRYSRQASSVFAVALAVLLSSYLSLQATATTISWNSPMEISAYFAQKALLAEAFPSILSQNDRPHVTPNWQNQYVLWLGPVLGALVGCILYRGNQGNFFVFFGTFFTLNLAVFASVSRWDKFFTKVRHDSSGGSLVRGGVWHR